MNNTTQKENNGLFLENPQNQNNKVYINFESNEKYFLLKFASIENKEIKINKNNQLKKVLEHYTKIFKSDINFYYSDYFLKDIIYNVLYINNDFILLQENDNFILYDLTKDIYHDFILINLINDIEDFEIFMTLKLQDYNIKYDNDIISDIIVNFENMNK